MNAGRLSLLGIVLLVVCAIGAILKGDLLAAGQEKKEPTPYPSEIYYFLVNTEFTLLHELGHALIAELKIPVLGREEDAADQIATMLLLAERDDRLKGSIIQKMNLVGIELRIEAVEDEIAYWDSHPPAIQRFYNLLCLAYGMNPGPLTGYLETNWLPWERGWYCDKEYHQVLRAMRWIYQQYGQGGPPIPALADDAEIHPFHPPLAAARQAGGVERASRPAKRGKITVEYEVPLTLDGKVLLNPLKLSKLAEHLARQVGQVFQLPRDLVISFANCGDDAYWNERSGKIVVCYRLLETYYEHARKAQKMKNMLPEELAPLNVVVPTQIYDALNDRANKEKMNINDITVEALRKYLNSPAK